jgi:outer membrane immunogenic protein
MPVAEPRIRVGAANGIAGCADGDIVSQTASSFALGGQVGYRYQWGNLVVGAEGMIDLFPASVTSPAVLPVPNRVRTTSFDALYSGTGQLGYAMGSLLFYGKGGWASTGIRFDANNLNPGPGIPVDLIASQSVNGYITPREEDLNG